MPNTHSPPTTAQRAFAVAAPVQRPFAAALSQGLFLQARWFFSFSVWNGGVVAGWVMGFPVGRVFWVVNDVGACNRVVGGGLQRVWVFCWVGFLFFVWNGGGGRLVDGFSGWVPMGVGFLGWFGLGSSAGGFSCGSPLPNTAKVLHRPLLAICCPFGTFGSVCFISSEIIRVWG